MVRQRQGEKRKSQPILDAQELEQIECALSESFHAHKRITLKLFDEFQNVELSGIVTTIQAYRKEIKLTTSQDEWQWIRIVDILSAE